MGPTARGRGVRGRALAAGMIQGRDDQGPARPAGVGDRQRGFATRGRSGAHARTASRAHGHSHLRSRLGRRRLSNERRRTRRGDRRTRLVGARLVTIGPNMTRDGAWARPRGSGSRRRIATILAGVPADDVARRRPGPDGRSLGCRYERICGGVWELWSEEPSSRGGERTPCVRQVPRRPAVARERHRRRSGGVPEHVRTRARRSGPPGAVRAAPSHRSSRRCRPTTPDSSRWSRSTSTEHRMARAVRRLEHSDARVHPQGKAVGDRRGRSAGTRAARQGAHSPHGVTLPLSATVIASKGWPRWASTVTCSSCCS